jgi:Domain of unknown function DUF29
MHPRRCNTEGIAMSEYDTDILSWSKRQAELLRIASRHPAYMAQNEIGPDWLNIAEEIESLGKSLEREFASRISTILIHLIKLKASPATEPRIGWAETIREQRDEIERVLKEAPKLRQTIGTVVDDELRGARKRVRATLADYGEQPRVDIDALTFTEEQVLGDWFPDA